MMMIRVATLMALIVGAYCQDPTGKAPTGFAFGTIPQGGTTDFTQYGVTYSAHGRGAGLVTLTDTSSWSCTVGSSGNCDTSADGMYDCSYVDSTHFACAMTSSGTTTDPLLMVCADEGLRDVHCEETYGYANSNSWSTYTRVFTGTSGSTGNTGPTWTIPTQTPTRMTSGSQSLSSIATTGTVPNINSITVWDSGLYAVLTHGGYKCSSTCYNQSPDELIKLKLPWITTTTAAAHLHYNGQLWYVVLEDNDATNGYIYAYWFQNSGGAHSWTGTTTYN